MAIGSTKMLMSSRYSGNTHVAVSMWRSSTFSTTTTCHWRGRKSDREHRQHDQRRATSRSSGFTEPEQVGAGRDPERARPNRSPNPRKLTYVT